MLNLSALFISQQRMNELLGANLLHRSMGSFSLADRKVGGLQRRQVLTAYEEATIEWLNRADLPTLGELIVGEELRYGKFFTHIGPFYGRATMESDGLFFSDKPLKREAVIWTKLDGLKAGHTLTLQVHPENYTTRSAAGELAGRKRLFLVGRLTDCDAKQIRAQAYVIGHLHEQARPNSVVLDRFTLLSHQMEVYPSMIENFSLSQPQKMPTLKELQRLLQTSEVEVKTAFANIIGEPFIPKDWGGETSDLVSTQIRLKGESVTTAFAFKGPAKPKPLTVADLGKNGDQISRLFSEPCDLVILQHCHKVTSAVRDHMRAFATRFNRLRPFCIIDGADTVRILRAYRQLGFGSSSKTRIVIGKRLT